MAKIERELSEHFANIQGEGLASEIMAFVTLDLMISMATDKRAALAMVAANVEKLLAASTPIGGDAELNERSHEVTRARLDARLALLHKLHLPKRSEDESQ